MPPKQKKPPATLTSGALKDAPVPKSSRIAWKTGEQLEYLLDQWPGFITHQTSGTLDRFWPRVYDMWYKKWPVASPTPMAVDHAGSLAAAILTARTENNQRIRTWFHNRARPNAKASRSNLRLNQNEKRKLAPIQAYCTYAWDSGLKGIVCARWEEQKQSRMFADEEDPSPELVQTPESASHIPIDFKLKIAKDVYESLSPKEKKEIDDRREAERKQQYRSIADIKDIRERDKKLTLHQQNQPSVTKSLIRVLKNLEDQAGCVAHLLVGYIDPTDGSSTFQNFSQGKTDLGLEFAPFCGKDWDEVIEKRFKEWAMSIFGEMGSNKRSTFMLSDKPLAGQGVASSSTGGALQTPGIPAVEDFSETQLRMNIATADRAIGASGINPPQPLETLQAVPSQTMVPPFIDNRPTTVQFQSEAVGFVSPQQIFPPHVFVESIKNNPAVVSPVIPEVPHLVAPFPTLVSSQTTILGQVNVPPMIPEPPLVAPSPVLELSQTVTPSPIVISPMVPEAPPFAPPPIVIPPTVPEFPRVINLQGITDQCQVSDPPQVIDEHQTVTSAYKRRDQTNATAAIQSRRNSIEGAPDIMLTLGGSGYELVTPSMQPDIPATPPPTTPSSTTPSSPTPSSTTPSSTTPSSPAPSLDELVVPSSQHSLEEPLAIPAEVEASDSNTPPTDEAAIPSLLQSLEGTSAVPGGGNITSRRFYFAPRVIPDYDIDRSDFPSWLLERDRLDFILSVEAGHLWLKLITTWLRQERRLGFGLNDKIGATLSMKKKPEILKDYFKWHHNPSKGSSAVLPGFGDEVSVWWMSVQPKWRYKDEDPHKSRNDYSYMLAGGKKGVFLLILCLAWWDNAHGRDMEREKVRRREAAKAAGKDDTTLDFGDLPEHDAKWFNIVNDLIVVLELAQGWPVPGEDIPGAVEAAPARRKRAVERADLTSRKKKKVS